MPNAETLPDLLLGHGIRLKRYTPGASETHVRCPKCEGGSTGKDFELSVKIDDDGQGATWICYRTSCQWKGGGRLATARRPQEPQLQKPRQKPPAHPVTMIENRPDWLYNFFAERHIGARTVNLFGLYATNRRFPQIGERPAIVFPYVFQGEVVNRKYRPFPDKNPQLQESDALHTLFNVDRLGEAPEEIIWVEGCPDVMALFECGFPHAVTLKDGAGGVGDKRFEALRTHAETLEKAKRIVLAGDNDAPGRELQEELARRLGRHRCWMVTWPEDCKDACDVLVKHGLEAVTEAIRTAAAYPIEGLQRIVRGSLRALRRQPPPATMSTGARATDAILKLPTEGRLVVVLGIPSHGKTSWTRFVGVHTAAEHDRRWAIFSPEMQPWLHFAAECAEVYSGKPFWPLRGLESMTEQEIDEAEDWLADRITMLVCDAEKEAPSLEWILDKSRATVLRDGTTDLLIDPWNEIEHQREHGTNETDYIGRCLQRLKAFALRYSCNVWVIVHPAKPALLKTGEQRPVPGPYDCSGSAHWVNKPDIGITVHSPQAGVAEIHLWKARQRRWGKRGDVAVLDYDALTGRYRTQISAPTEEVVSPPPGWMD